uniref:Protein phosphatase 1 regulatory subunit 3A n=1 Tax=Phasianus colchicus TaxID=9054 RepID=A0A669NXL8_PHACC
MESFEGPSQVSKANLLEVPTVNDYFSEDEDVKPDIKHRFSPLPRRRNSASSEEEEADAPTTIARKVSFADAFGFDLVSVKEFDTWEIPNIAQNNDLEDEAFPQEEFFLTQLFTLPTSQEEVLQKVREHKVLLESIVFLPGITCMNGIIRVLNVSFEKFVYVRMTLDDWVSYYDILAEFMPNSCGSETDQFCFKISLVPPYQRDGAKVEFCIRYETSIGTFWANNDDKNYTLICHKKDTVPKLDNKPHRESADRHLKGCLKTRVFVNSSDANIPEIVCSQAEDKESAPANENIKDKNAEYNQGDHEDDEKELELLLNQHFTGAKGTSSRDERNLDTTEPVNFPSETVRLEKNLTCVERSSDLLRHPVPISSLSENTSQVIGEELKGNAKYSIGGYNSHPSEKEVSAGSANSTISSVRDESLQLKACITGTLDGNANPAPEHQVPKISHQTLDSLSSAADKNEGKIEMIESKVQAHLKGDLHTDTSAYTDVSIDSTKSQYTHKKGVCELSEKNYNTDTEKEKRVIEIADLALIGEEEAPKPFKSHRKHAFSASFLPDEDNKYRARPAQAGPGAYLPENESRAEDAQEHRGFTRLKDRGKTENGNKGGLTGTESEENATGLAWKRADSGVRWAAGGDAGAQSSCTKELFTCQEAESCEKSPVSEHGIKGKAEAGTAYIIKTTSESAPEKMSASEKAVIAKLPQEIALSDRPTEEKETAFDTHEGRNDGSHYALCQLNTVGVLYDTEFEKESVLDIYNARVHETLQGETMSVCSSREKRAKAKPDIGDILPAEGAVKASSAEKKEGLGQGLHSEEVSKYSQSAQKHRYSEELAELYTDMDHPYIHSEFKVIEKVVAESGYDFSLPNEMKHINKCLFPEAERKEVPSTSDTTVAREGRGSNIGQCFHQAEFKQEKSLRPEISISKATKEVGGRGSDSHHLITEGKTLNWLDDSQDEKQNISHSADMSDQNTEEQMLSSETPGLKEIGCKIFCFFFFLVFAATLYHYDLMVCLALYLFSLYWLYWEGRRSKESVKKE